MIDINIRYKEKPATNNSASDRVLMTWFVSLLIVFLFFPWYIGLKNQVSILYILLSYTLLFFSFIGAFGFIINFYERKWKKLFLDLIIITTGVVLAYYFFLS